MEQGYRKRAAQATLENNHDKSTENKLE